MFGFEKRPIAPKRQRGLRFETLESRNLLSASPTDYTTIPTTNVDLVAPIANVALANVTAEPSVSAAPMTSGPSTSFFTPATIRKAYGFDKLPQDGTGQTIAIVVAFDDPGTLNNLNTFDAQFGLPTPAVTVVRQHGPHGEALGFNQTWALEAAMDMEWAHAIAPKANLMLLEAFDSTFTNLLSMVDFAKNSAGVSVVSMSFASVEFAGETALDAHFTTPSGHIPVTFVSASGDSGAAAMYPAASPNVLGVGGTKLLTQNFIGLPAHTETAWSGSGGGISSFETKPAFQNGFQGNSTRTTPDISYVGDPSTGFNVFFGAGGGWQGVAGTSAGAPQWSALIALANQGRVPNQIASIKTTLAHASQDIYGLPATDFFDITSGNNGAFSAGAGYDFVTGRGSPRADLIVPALINAEGLVVKGTIGGTAVAAPYTGAMKMSPAVVTTMDNTPAATFSTELAFLTWNNGAGENLPATLLTVNPTNVVPTVNAGTNAPAVPISGLDVLLANVHNGDQVDRMIDSLFDFGHSPSSIAKTTGWDKLDRI